MGMDFIPTGINTGVSGSITGKEVVNTVPANGSLVIPAGLYAQYTAGANVRVEVQDSTLSWQIVIAVGVGGFIASDGTNMRWTNTAGANQTVTTIKIG